MKFTRLHPRLYSDNPLYNQDNCFPNIRIRHM